MNRRTFVLGSAATGAAAFGADRPTSDPGDPRLTARPAAPSEPVARGEPLPLGLGAGRDGVLYVPRGYSVSAPAPMLVLLHGAGGAARNWFGSWGARADELGIVMLAPESRSVTWDAIRGAFGPDVAFIDRALADSFGRVAVDPHRIAVAGFSDGASYAVSLGLANGDLFSRIVAFSPGFIMGTSRHGKPPVFISHGRSDGILPLASTSGRIVPRLREDGYPVEFAPFDGGHEVPSAVSGQAMQWLVSGWKGLDGGAGGRPRRPPGAQPSQR